jgi:hypothetical protein
MLRTNGQWHYYIDAWINSRLVVCQERVLVHCWNRSHSLHIWESLAIPMLPQGTTDPFQIWLYDLKGKMPLKLHLTFSRDISSYGTWKTGSQIEQCSLALKGLWLHDERLGKTATKSCRIEGSWIYWKTSRHGCSIGSTLCVPVARGQVTITRNKNVWSNALHHLFNDPMALFPRSKRWRQTEEWFQHDPLHPQNLIWKTQI